MSTEAPLPPAALTPERIAEIRADAMENPSRITGKEIVALCDALTASRREREEARRFGEMAAAKYNELLERGKELRCAFCDELYPPGTPPTQHEALTAHVRICQKHPMRDVERDARRCRAECDNMETAWRYVNVLLEEAVSKRDAARADLAQALAASALYKDSRDKARAALVDLMHAILGCDGYPCRVESDPVRYAPEALEHVKAEQRNRNLNLDELEEARAALAEANESAARRTPEIVAERDGALARLNSRLIEAQYEYLAMPDGSTGRRTWKEACIAAREGRDEAQAALASARGAAIEECFLVARRQRVFMQDKAWRKCVDSICHEIRELAARAARP